jgi:ketosteroid isomerase-like protein
VSKENIDLVRRSIEAYNRRDFETLEALNHPDIELDWTASRGFQAGVYRGWEEVMAFYRNFLGTFEKVEIEPERFIETGDLVVVPNSAQIQGRDGIETTAHSAFVFELRDRRIARLCLYQETEQALKAAGLKISAS